MASERKRSELIGHHHQNILLHKNSGDRLKQVFTIEQGDFEIAGIQIFDATEVDTEMSRHTQHFVVSINAAFLAKVMLRDLIVELVKADVIFIRIDVQLSGRNRFGAHHRTLARANRTVAAQAPGYYFAFIVKFYSAAMAAPMVMLWHMFLLLLLTATLLYSAEQKPVNTKKIGSPAGQFINVLQPGLRLLGGYRFLFDRSLGKIAQHACGKTELAVATVQHRNCLHLDR
jgi:hypothetical protein